MDQLMQILVEMEVLEVVHLMQEQVEQQILPLKHVIKEVLVETVINVALVMVAAVAVELAL